jgi:isoleucyl-tRNA synthetase
VFPKRTGGRKKMTATILRRELHTMIDTMPDQFIRAMVPLVTYITEEYWKPVIEPADPDEIALIAESVERYHKDPSSFVPLESIR